jgi:hypothetical protein
MADIPLGVQWPRTAVLRRKLAEYWRKDCSVDINHTLYCLESGLKFEKHNGYYQDSRGNLSVPFKLLETCPASVAPSAMWMLYMHLRIGCAPCLHTAAVLCLSDTSGAQLAKRTTSAVCLHMSGCTPLFAMLQKLVLHPRLSCFINRIGRHLYATHTDATAAETNITAAMSSQVVVATESMHQAVKHAITLGRIVVFPTKISTRGVLVYPGNTCLRMSWKNHALLLLCLVYSEHPYDLPEIAVQLRDQLRACGKPPLHEVLRLRLSA